MTLESLRAFFLFSILLISCVQTFAIHQIFDPSGSAINLEIAAHFSFPADLEKTNLAITAMSSENPFEWAGPIWTKRASYLYPCTGGVIVLSNSKPEDKVLVLTAGHCVTGGDGNFLKPNESIVDQQLESGSMWFDFPRERSYFVRDAAGLHTQTSRTFEMNRIIFASFDVVDLALLEINLRYRDLFYKNQKLPILSLEKIKIGETIQSFGLPNSTIYKSELFHQASCKVIDFLNFESVIKNVDPNTAYIFRERISSTCTLFGGMSGGYVRNNKGQIVGVNGAVSSEQSIINSTAPLANCINATNSGFNNDCLKELGKSIAESQ